MDLVLALWVALVNRFVLFFPPANLKKLEIISSKDGLGLSCLLY
jgi:hypothetical protein